jgi:hypothetical protein
VPVWLGAAVLFGVAAADPVGAYFSRQLVSNVTAGVALGGAFLLVAIHFIGGRMALPAATALAGDLARARRLFEAGREKCGVQRDQDQARIKNEFEDNKRKFNQE